MKRMKDWFYEHRVVVLFLALVLGLLIALMVLCLYEILACELKCKNFISNFLCLERTRTNVPILLISLPVVFCLWLFRTKDRKEQIQKTKESTQSNALFNALKMLSEKDNLEARVIGLQQLIYLKNKEKVFQEQIDNSTHHINFNEAELQGANLQGANLEGTKLQEANLQGANLQKAKLQRAQLQEAKLQRANLEGANLEGAYLEGANLRRANLQEAQLQGAYYSDKTEFPNGFNPKEAGMQLVQK